MNDHIPSLDARRPLHRKKKEDAAHNRSNYRPAAVVATEARYTRKCLVCTKPTGDPARRYCPAHNSAYYKWLECLEPGCELVGERTIPGQTVYRCPLHRDVRVLPPAPEPAAEDLEGTTSGREQVRELLEQRRRNLAAERPRRSLPPRPPYNIGHYDGRP